MSTRFNYITEDQYEVLLAEINDALFHYCPQGNEAEDELRGTCMSVSRSGCPPEPSTRLQKDEIAPVEQRTILTYRTMDVTLQALAKGSVQISSLTLTMDIVEELPGLEYKSFTTQYIHHHLWNEVYQLYRDALIKEDEATDQLFIGTWEEFRQLVGVKIPYFLLDANNGDNILERGRKWDGGKIAWANEGMNNWVLLALLNILVQGFKFKDRPLCIILLKMALALKSLIIMDGKDKTNLLVEYFRNNAKETIILPVFSARHATYAVIAPSTSRPGLFRIVMCNGGNWCERFADQRFTNYYSFEGNSRGICVLLADFAHTLEFVQCVDLHWEDDGIFNNLATFIDKRLCQDLDRCANGGPILSRERNFLQLDQHELKTGKSIEFGNKIMCLIEQQQGNCAVHNLMHALASCEGDIHTACCVTSSTWSGLFAVGYCVNTIMCTALVTSESKLQEYLGLYVYDVTLHHFVVALIDGPNYITPKVYIESLRVVYENNQSLVPDQSGRILYCMSPDGKVVVGSVPVNGWDSAVLTPVTIDSSSAMCEITDWLKAN